MKRDVELMRKILFYIEDNYEAGTPIISEIEIEGYELKVIADHCDLLYQGGLLKSYKPTYYLSGGMSFLVGNLTNAGYDYLELIRNEDIWGKTTEMIEEKKLPKTINNISRVAGTFVGAMLNQLTDK